MIHSEPVSMRLMCVQTQDNTHFRGSVTVHKVKSKTRVDANDKEELEFLLSHDIEIQEEHNHPHFIRYKLAAANV